MIPLFVHLPKTGGTSLSNCICAQYYRQDSGAGEDPDPYFKGGIYYYPTGFFEGGCEPHSEEILGNLQRETLQAVVGHFSFGLHRFLRRGTGFGYLTMLRSPADRIASLYRHLMHFDAPDPALHRSLVREKPSLREFASSDRLPMLENDQTRRIAGVAGPCTRADLERAKRRLAEDFAWVGVTERFDESLVLIKRRLGWAKPLQYYRENVSAELGIRGEPLDSGTVAAIHERNAYDLELHAWAESLLDREREKELGDGFLEEVARFREHNQKMNALWREG